MSHLNPTHEQLVISGDGSTYHGITDTNGTAIVISYDPSTLSQEAKSNEEDSGDITALVSEVEDGTATGKTYSIPAMLELVEYINQNFRVKFNSEDRVLVKLVHDVFQITEPVTTKDN
jgi:hypothetical protein